MRKRYLFMLAGAAALLLGLTGTVQAQDVVYSGDIEMGDFTGWTLTGGNAHSKVIEWQVVQLKNSFCVKRRPGTPSDNGAIEQNVHLVGGVTYAFSADIAANESG